MSAVLYVAHPLAPNEEEIGRSSAWSASAASREIGTAAAFRENLARATRWQAWLCESFPSITFLAPWFALRRSLRSEAWHRDTFAIVERCDGIVLCGGRISDGMRREMEHGRDNRPRDVEMNDWPFDIYNLTKGGDEPPSTPTPLKISLKRCAAIFDEYRGGRTIPADEWELL